MTKKNTRKNKQKSGQKNDLPKLASDTDFLALFSADDETRIEGKEQKTKKPVKSLNKHGLPFLDDYERFMTQAPDFEREQTDSGAQSEDEAPDLEPDVDFSTLLEKSLKQNRIVRHTPKPMPLKKRLKRYPLPEADLDLHGFTAIGATLKARSFISNAYVQGFFTLRIIVGKGLHSEDGPVLPHVVEDLLKEMKKQDIVLAWEWEGRKKSKSGSVVVFLKRFSH